jgi:adenylate cyclase
MAEKTIFSRIIDREIPAKIVYEDEHCLAFEDIHPVAPTHLIVIPKREIASVDDIEELDEAVVGHLFTAMRAIAAKLKISHTSVQQYRSQLDRNVREIGRQLGVAYVLEGTVQRAPNRMRVNAKLIDARTDTQIWAESYDRDVADLFVIQSDLAQAIVNQLQARLSPEQKAEIEDSLAHILPFCLSRKPENAA